MLRRRFLANIAAIGAMVGIGVPNPGEASSVDVCQPIEESDFDLDEFLRQAIQAQIDRHMENAMLHGNGIESQS